jgi:hypothetical protein
VSFGLEGRLQPPGDRRGDARGRALDELAHVFELVERDLAVDAELGRDFVYAWVGHISPVRVRSLAGADVKG